MRVLIIGFSVTEMPGSYVPRLQRLLDQRAPSWSLTFCGLGGVTIEALSYFVDQILDEYAECDHICYEVASGNGRYIYQGKLNKSSDFEQALWSMIEALVLKAKRRNASVSFINFPRQDVLYSDDFLERIIREVCIIHHLPALELSRELFELSIPPEDFLLDSVHPTPLGAEFYAEKVYYLLEQIANQSRPPALPGQSASGLGYLSFADLSQAENKRFERRGFSAPYIEIKGGGNIEVNLPEPMLIKGLSAIVGPKSGIINVYTENYNSFNLYDEYCYYERMMTINEDMGVSGWVKIELSEDLPTIPLLKGEPDLGERSIGLIHLYTEPV